MAKDDEGDRYDALDEALMETFPASDPIAVSDPIRWLGVAVKVPPPGHS
jgi:hypothetical protein